jgi:CRISPR/Cas system-associated exonuclease Cas4 (RecB family)
VVQEVINISFRDNFIEKLAQFIADKYLDDTKDLSNLCCVFPGRRPALFLRQEIAKIVKGSYLPPQMFSINELVDYFYQQNGDSHQVTSLDSCFIIYDLAKKYFDSLLNNNQGFDQFLPWAREITAFIEQLDLEMVDDDKLYYIQDSAVIGYSIPSEINHLLQNLIKLRKLYHQYLQDNCLYSAAQKNLMTLDNIKQRSTQDFKAIFFCNFFYLNQCQSQIIKELTRKNESFYVFQGDHQRWPVLKENISKLNIVQPETPTPQNDLPLEKVKIYRAFDMHSQLALVSRILQEITDKEQTLIVLPQPEAVVPLLTLISSSLEEANISLGYPLRRTPVYVLFNILIRVQENKRGDKYYAKDYLSLLRHPLLKNISFDSTKEGVIRIVVHKIEEFLQGDKKSAISGNLFISLQQIEQQQEIYLDAADTAMKMGLEVDAQYCYEGIKKLHRFLFFNWHQVDSFSKFSQKLTLLLDLLANHSRLDKFPFNIKAITRLYELADSFCCLHFKNQAFSTKQIWNIFKQEIDKETIAFIGSPLRGTQILGFLETRSLNFKNVIMIDLNESVLPKLKIHQPLIPREVMLSLGLDRLEKEEQIQHYHFLRLISGAQKVHLIYQENQSKEKSRFIEQIIWHKQKQKKKLDVFDAPKVAFAAKVKYPQKRIKKTDAMLRFLRESTYSASRVDTYLNCPLRFYYRYVLGLKEREHLLEEIQASQVGSFIHELLEESFRCFQGVKPVIDKNFKKDFFARLEDKFDKELAQRMHSDAFLLKRIINKRMQNFLEQEEKRGVDKIVSLEKQETDYIEFSDFSLKFRYIADRIDQIDNKLFIIDYKTGAATKKPRSLNSLRKMQMNRQSIRDNVQSFQLPLYYYFISKKFPGSTVNAQLYNLRTLSRDSFISGKYVKNKAEILQYCLDGLEFIIKEIFDIDTDFKADKDGGFCRHCDFNYLCE